MKRSKTRLLSLLLTLCMMLSMFTGLGVTASAADREPVYVNGTDVSAGGYWKIADSSDDTVGDANDYNYHYDPNTQTLTLNNAIFNKVYAVELGSSQGPYYRYYGIYAYYSDPATSLKLVLNGTNSIQSELLKTPSGPIDNSFGIALLQKNVFSAGAIEVSGTGSLEVCGAYRALFTGDLKAASDMTVEGSEAIDGSSFEPFDPAKTGSEHGAQNPYLAVRIIGPGSTAPAGKRTKTLDCTAFTGDASSDTEAWTWDYDTKTLTLSGVDIAVNEYLDPRNKTTLGVILPADSTVVLNGDNKIVSTAPSTDGASTFGITARGNLTIVGDGTLAVEAGGCGQNTGIYVDNMDDTELLTIGDGKSAPTVIANAKDTVGDNANSSDGISTPTLVLKKGSLTASGGNARYSSIGVSVLDRILIHDGFTLTASSGTVNFDFDIAAAVVGNMESATPGKVVSIANGQAATIEMPGPGDEMMSIPMVKQSGSAPAVVTLVDGGSTPAGTRTTALDLALFSETNTYGATNGGSGTLWTNAAEKWSWDTATKQLTLFGLNLVADYFLPLNLPDGAEIILAAGTENSIRSSSAPIEMGITLIRGEGALTISGSGKLTVGSGTDNPATTFAIAVMNDLTINLTGAGQVTALGAVGNARPDLPTAAIISLMGSIVLGDDVIIAEPAGTSIQTVQGMQLTADQSGSPVTGVILRTGSAANMIKHLSVHIDELKPGPLSGAKITITGSADMPATSPASFQAENVVWYVVPEDGGKLQKATEFEAGKTYAPGFTFRFDPSTTPFPEADQEHTIRDTSVYVYYKNQLLSFDLAETPYLTPLDQNTMGLELPLVFVASSGDAPTEHTITFDTQGGDPLPGGSTAKTVGGKLAALPTPTQTGKYFAGWYTELLGGQLVTEKTVFTAPATIYARWTIAKIEHTTQPDSNALQGAVAMTDLEVLDKIPLTDAEKNGTDDINIYLNVQDINQTIPT
ncbi:MAG: InlB B-repeat-containing protein, partial [Agathobaculum sp.]|uniref:InlB B-repeat-containing protein n=1 Tax=Agathobaculum sp. TaxID=2048138 RepID=UPI002A7F9611